MHEVATGSVEPEAALDRLRTLPFADLGFAKVDHHRALRQGVPETVFGAGKTPEHIVAIVKELREREANVLVTRCSAEAVAAVQAAFPDVVHNEAARTLSYISSPPPALDGTVAIVCAGTSDLPVAEEAAVTCEMLGCTVDRVADVGVAGIHRLFDRLDMLRRANALVVCAGMEGALPSVVAGLVDKPVIAVPTSIGYGASFGGVTALLGMLNSCASGLAVVNIDNGYGAGHLAALINRIANGK